MVYLGLARAERTEVLLYSAARLAALLLALGLVAGCSSVPAADNPNLPQRGNAEAGSAGGGGTNNRRNRNQRQDPVYESANAYVELALNYITQGDYPAALEQLERSADLAAINPELDHAYGIYYQRTGDLDQAKKRFAAAVRRSPRNPQFNNNYGVLLSQREEYSDALKRFSIAYSDENYANRAAAYENSGDVKAKQGEHSEAVAFYLQAQELNPDWFVLESKIANELYNQGDFANSYVRFQNYISQVEQLNILPSDQDIELGLAIAAALKDYEKVEEYQTILQERGEQNFN